MANRIPFRIINDPLYGSIELTREEADLIDTPIFQRLRRIRQTGLLQYVFPGTEHSRFTHSLGVLHIMSCIAGNLSRNNCISGEDARLLRIAALLHDIGHYPLSHVGEQVYQSMEEEESKGTQRHPDAVMS